jgi:hypothetical protein
MEEGRGDVRGDGKGTGGREGGLVRQRTNLACLLLQGGIGGMSEETVVAVQGCGQGGRE